MDNNELYKSDKISSCLFITYHRPWNYGAVFQTLALQKALDRLEVDNLILDYRDQRIENSRKVIQSNFHDIKGLGRSLFYSPLELIKSRKFSKFMKENYRLTNVCNTAEDLSHEAKNVELVLAGSDLIWNWELNNGPDPVYFLNFAWDLNIRKASYASSIGSSYIPECYISKYSSYLSELDYVSVREETAQKVLSQVVGSKDIVNVLDPVLLHEEKFWNDYTKKVNLPERYICAYIVEYNDKVVECVNALSKLLNLPVVHFAKRKWYKTDENIHPTASPSEFLYILKNATYVITNSFHGVAFSILFHKDFVCIPHSTRGSRMIDLISECELDVRLISESGQLEKTICKSVNYDVADNNLVLLRKESYDYLKKVIYRGNLDE